ncbi:MAG: hypothetical protein AB1861_03890 [Cyanobacteriota bacterium]
MFLYFWKCCTVVADRATTHSLLAFLVHHHHIGNATRKLLEVDTSPVRPSQESQLKYQKNY